jgi:hypothetical protein
MKTSRIIDKKGKTYFGTILKYRPDRGDDYVIFADHDANIIRQFDLQDLTEFVTINVQMYIDHICDQDHLKEAREIYKLIE